MQLQRIELKKLGTTERILRSDTQGNFDKLENAVNSNAGATEAWYKQQIANLAAESADRQADDTAEAQTRAETDKELDGKINALRTRLSTAEGNINDLQKRIASLEDQVKKLNEIIFGTRYINDTDEIPLDDSMTPGNDVEVNDTETVNDDEAEVRTPDPDVLADEIN